MKAAWRLGGWAARRPDGSSTAELPNRRTLERLSPETRAAIDAARAAGELLLARAGRARDVRLKSAKDPVTEVDVSAERCIRRILGRQFPRIGFVGEEGSVAEGADGRWIVDPIDGTMAFVANLPFFSVLISLKSWWCRYGFAMMVDKFGLRAGESILSHHLLLQNIPYQILRKLSFSRQP